MLAGALSSGAGLAAQAAVGSGEDDSKAPATVGIAQPTATGAAATSTAQVKRGGTNITALTTTYNDIMDPHTSLAQAWTLWSLIGNTPLRPTPDKKLVGDLVQKWEVPGDGSEIVLTVRPGVVWQNRAPTNGRAWVADDLAFNLTRISGKLNPDKVGLFQRAASLPNFESATAVDEKTVRVKLTAPHSSFINGLADARNAMVPRDYVEKGGDFTKPAEMIGTGAWILDQWENQNKAVFKANPTYWEKGKPYLDSVQFVWYGDRLSSLTDFTRGKFDYFEGPSVAERDSLKKLGSDGREETWLLANWPHFRFNTTRAPFTDARVRKALQLVLDYKGINDPVFGQGYWDYTGPMASAFPEAYPGSEVGKMPGYNPATKQADIKTAKDLMSAAGFPDGNISFKFTPYTNTGSIGENPIRAIDMWKSVWPGMKVEIDLPADTTAASRRQSSSDFDMFSYTIAPSTDGLLDMQTHVFTGASRNYGKFSDPTIDAQLTKAATQFEAAARTQTLKDVQKSLLETHNPLIHISIYKYSTVFAKKIKGMEGFGQPFGGSSYDNKVFSKDMWFDA